MNFKHTRTIFSIQLHNLISEAMVNLHKGLQARTAGQSEDVKKGAVAAVKSIGIGYATLCSMEDPLFPFHSYVDIWGADPSAVIKGSPDGDDITIAEVTLADHQVSSGLMEADELFVRGDLDGSAKKRAETAEQFIKTMRLRGQLADESRKAITGAVPDGSNTGLALTGPGGSALN